MEAASARAAGGQGGSRRDAADAGLIVGAGLAAGAINTIVGSGSLVTFPTLLALGYAPVAANIANTLGLVPDSASGAVAYRRELAGQRARAIRLGIAVGSVVGGQVGASAGRRLPPLLLRGLIIVVGVVVAVRLSLG